VSTAHGDRLLVDARPRPGNHPVEGVEKRGQARTSAALRGSLFTTRSSCCGPRRSVAILVSASLDTRGRWRTRTCRPRWTARRATTPAPVRGAEHDRVIRYGGTSPLSGRERSSASVPSRGFFTRQAKGAFRGTFGSGWGRFGIRALGCSVLREGGRMRGASRSERSAFGCTVLAPVDRES